MPNNTGKVVGWLAVALLLAANVALANSSIEGAPPPAKYSCGTVIGPGGGTQSICMEYLYEQCDCPTCVDVCASG